MFLDSSTVMSDMAQSKYLHQIAPDQIWQDLLYLYQRNEDRRPSIIHSAGAVLLASLTYLRDRT